jgi:hypothetical protein
MPIYEPDWDKIAEAYQLKLILKDFLNLEKVSVDVDADFPNAKDYIKEKV